MNGEADIIIRHQNSALLSTSFNRKAQQAALFYHLLTHLELGIKPFDLILQQAVAKFQTNGNQSNIFVQQLVAQIF